ncbi:hypothetical protein [Paractinoplanes durhamensis]
MYLAGLLLATGASLALAGPASAASSHNHHGKCSHHHSSSYHDYDFDDEGDDFLFLDNSNTQEFNFLSNIGIGVLGTGIGRL